eukprot:6186457-Pleurochrysis_carterae.AAC.3
MGVSEGGKGGTSKSVRVQRAMEGEMGVSEGGKGEISESVRDQRLMEVEMGVSEGRQKWGRITAWRQ